MPYELAVPLSGPRGGAAWAGVAVSVIAPAIAAVDMTRADTVCLIRVNAIDLPASFQLQRELQPVFKQRASDINEQ
jgi:hypothetical protein